MYSTIAPRVRSDPMCPMSTDRSSGRLVGHRRQDLDPLDRVDPEVPLEVHREVQHVGRVARLLRHDRQHQRLQVDDGSDGPRGRRRRSAVAASWRTEALHVFDDRAEGAERPHVPHVHRPQLRRLIGHRRENLDPLDRVDPEVALEVHREVQHVGRIAGLLRHDREHQRLEVDGRSVSQIGAETFAAECAEFARLSTTGGATGDTNGAANGFGVSTATATGE